MPQFGQYDPQNPQNISELFVFQETPVTSVKLNRWNGNIAAGFTLLHRVLSALSANNQSAVIITGTDSALQVTPTDPAGMFVQINAGWAVLGERLTGLDEAVERPLVLPLDAPVNQPRIDVVFLDPSGTVSIAEGEENADPAPPGVPDGALSLAHLFHRVGTTQILNNDNGSDSYILDQRPRLLLGEAHRHGTDRIPPESPDGVRTEFSTLHVFREGSLDVFVNGVLQTPGLDYLENAARTGYNFITPPMPHYRIQHRYLVDHQ